VDHIRLGEEISAIRDSLQDMAVHDLGFGHSRDGNSWALISVPSRRSARPRPARSFRRSCFAHRPRRRSCRPKLRFNDRRQPLALPTSMRLAGAS
jgi:hypothetical protein